MRIVLIESGGFVGVPLRYEVDVSALESNTMSALERVMATAPEGQQFQSTSAGGVTIRVERDDGRVNELTMSHAAPVRETAELVERLRAYARLEGKT